MVVVIYAGGVNILKQFIRNILHLTNYRAMDRYIKKYYKKQDLIGVEIGIGDGGHALDMLHHLPIKKLYLIDPYEEYIDGSGIKNLDESKILAERRLAKYFKQIKYFFDYSYRVVDKFDDNSVDFVYIDGNHSYASVIKDILLYYQKVKPSGILGGHDFSTDFLDVPVAVAEFSQQYDLKVYGRPSCNDWWVIKK